MSLLSEFLWQRLARTLAKPAVVDWLIRRASRTPYLHLTDSDGSVYMERYWLFNPYPAQRSEDAKGWRKHLPSIRLHRIMREDHDRHLHDHPYDARTIILRDYYIEQRLEADGTSKQYMRCPGDTARLQLGMFHRISKVLVGECWTLFITWKYQGTWGFLVGGKKVDWRTYLGVPK